jgi:hypothetical protein
MQNAERDSRGAKDNLLFHDMKFGQRIKNWKHLLGDTESKNKFKSASGELEGESEKMV